MTMTLSPEARETAPMQLLLPVYEPIVSPETGLVLPPPDVAAGRLGHNLAAVAVWDAMRPMLDDSSDRARQRAEIVPATSLERVPDEALPTRMRGSNHQLWVLNDGKLPSGSFKLRGAEATLRRAMERDPGLCGVVVASTGNHAAGVALTAMILGIEATVYMPEDAEIIKVENALGYGANVRFAKNLGAAVIAATEHGKRKESVFIHPYDKSSALVAGQGTASARLAEQLAAHGIDISSADLHTYFGVGGGGLAAGNKITQQVLFPDAHMHLAQAEGADVFLARLAGRPFDRELFDRTVDGAAVLDPGSLPYEILSSLGVHDTHVVSHAQIGKAMAVTGRFTDTCESAGGVPLAAALAAIEEAILKDPDGSSVHVAHISGINTTPQKVHYFATAACKAGLLSDREAFDLVSRANIGSRRAYNAIEEHAMALAAIKRAKSEVGFRRNGTRVVAGGW